MSKKTWDELVAEGQQLKVMDQRIEAEAGNIRWLWGDLALEVAPMGKTHGNTGAYGRLEKFADELDVSFKTLQMYRTVAEAWPDAMRVASEPWVVHQQLMGHDDREEIIANPVDVRTGEKLDRWTSRAVQRFLGKKASPHYVAPPVTTAEKADLARDLLNDPEVAAEVVTDAAAEQSLRTALAHQAQQATETPDQILARIGTTIDALDRIMKARRLLAEALSSVQQMQLDGTLNDDKRSFMLGRIASVETTTGWLRSFIESGTGDFDAELRALLAEETR